MGGPTSFVSFGFNHLPYAEHGPIDGSPGALVIDVRQRWMRNPWKEPALRGLTGLDGPVQVYLSTQPGFHDYVDRLVEDCRNHAGMVCLGCTGGRHRSVYLAVLLGDRFRVPVQHLQLSTTEQEKRRHG